MGGDVIVTLAIVFTSVKAVLLISYLYANITLELRR
jgi:hypothetical protein